MSQHDGDISYWGCHCEKSFKWDYDVGPLLVALYRNRETYNFHWSEFFVYSLPLWNMLYKLDLVIFLEKSRDFQLLLVQKNILFLSFMKFLLY